MIIKHYEEVNINRRIDTSDRVEMILDLNLVDLNNAKTNRKRIAFTIEQELILLLAGMGVTRYKLHGIDISLGVVRFEILDIGKFSYKNRIFQDAFFETTLTKLPEFFCVSIQDLNLLRTTINSLNRKHGYTTLEDLAMVKPNRKRMLHLIWEESGTSSLKMLCQYNKAKMLEKLGKDIFLQEVTRKSLHENV